VSRRESKSSRFRLGDTDADRLGHGFGSSSDAELAENRDTWWSTVFRESTSRPAISLFCIP